MRSVPANQPVPPTYVVESDTLRQPPDYAKTTPRGERTLNRIGIVCVGLPAKLKENERSINQRIAKLLDRYQDATFVCLERKSDRFTKDALELFGVTPEVLLMDESWRRVEVVARAGEFQGRQYEPGDKVTLYDARKQMRDSELVRTCDRVLVFAPRGSSGHWQEYVRKADEKRERYPTWPQTVFLAEYGEAPPKKPKTRRATKRPKSGAARKAVTT